MPSGNTRERLRLHVFPVLGRTLLTEIRPPTHLNRLYRNLRKVTGGELADPVDASGGRSAARTARSARTTTPSITDRNHHDCPSAQGLPRRRWRR
ncbi:MAG TPA: hypothetical protein VII33_00875 [Nakamurella sp.]